MAETETKSIKVFAEYLNNLRAVNLYVYLHGVKVEENLPVLSVKSNEIQIDKLGNKFVLDGLTIQDCTNLPPRFLDNNVLCYRLVVKPKATCGSATAEIVYDFEKTVDEGAKNLVKNSINNVALQEGKCYQIKCRFCLKYLSDVVKFERIRPLPSNNWVENAHEMWFCHPPEVDEAQGLHQDISIGVDKINLSKETGKNKSIVDLLKCPDMNYCFYGPCNWAINSEVAKGINKNLNNSSCLVPRADCSFCGNELGSFTSESCIKIWDYGIEWINESSDSSTSVDDVNLKDLISSRAVHNFKSIIFATIYELSDNPTFRFNVSSTIKGDSVFLWNIDRNLSVYEQQSIDSNEDVSTVLKRRKVAKFFFALKENNVVSISNPRELLIIRESEQNEQGILTIPDYVYRAGVDSLKITSVLYSRDQQTLQCGYLTFDV